MKTDPRRFAPFGLVVSLLALLAFLGFLFIKGLAATRIFVPPDPQLIERGMWISLSVFIFGLALSILLDPERARGFLVGRQAKYGSLAAIMLLAFLGILLFVNLLAFQVNKSWDLTEDKKNTLAPETITLLKNLSEPVNARAYYSSQADPSSAKKLLENFKQLGNDKFAYEFIDPVANPLAAQQDGITRDGTVVLQMANNKQEVTMLDEEGLASAIVKITNPEKLSVYFTTGHGEADIEQSGDATYTLVKRALENKNYTVNTLNIGSTGKVPEDAKAVVIAGLQHPMAADEVKSLEAYLDKGGALIVMQDPLALTKFGDAPDTLTDLLGKWGIAFENDVIVDPSANPPLLVYADPLNYGQHPITSKMRGVNSRFLTAQSLKVGTAPEGITLTPLAQTYPNAWGETDLASIQNNQVSFDAAKDIPGPLVLGVAGENMTSKGRLIVFGDSEFAADALYQRGNGDILINAVDWATQQEKLISLTPKNKTSRSFMPPGTLGLIGSILTSLCLIPLLIIAGGTASWFSRRRRG
jgi:ABC-type uncharacterized transport system involved in gliding motility auxiliary subunit